MQVCTETYLLSEKAIVILDCTCKRKICYGTQEESPLSDPGENKARLCIQFGDLIRRKRETYCRKFRKKEINRNN